MARVTPRSKKTAAPGTTDKSAGTKEKKEKIFHPALKAKDGKATEKITAKPDDFDPKVHKQLRKHDFAAEHHFLRFKASGLEAQAAKLRKDADASEKLGSAADRQKAKKLRAMNDKMAELRKQLEEQGVDVDALLDDNDEE